MPARFADFDPAFSEFDQLLDRYAYDHARRDEEDSKSPQPWRALGVHDSDASLEITVELDGLSENGIAVVVSDGLVTITLPKVRGH